MILWNHGVRDAHEPGRKSRVLPSHVPQPISPPRTGKQSMSRGTRALLHSLRCGQAVR
jgi:hypothetical protein